MKKLPITEIILVILGSLLYFFANLQRVAIPGAVFTLLQNDLNTTAQCIATLSTSFMYVYAISQLFIGVLIARYGGFRVLTFGAVLFFIGCLIFPLANSMPALYFSRVLIGCGSASFYLSLINETKRIVSHENFGIALSFVLLIGYLGGIVANAPIVICINNLGWRKVFFITAIATTFIALLFVIINHFSEKPKVNTDVKINFSLYKEVLDNKRNISIFLFAGLNYGLYYLLQTVIGKKFLEDFCSMSVINAALILSVMGMIYAFSGSIIAFISKITLNRRTIYLKIATLNTLFTFICISFCIAFNIKTPVIPCVLFCVITFWASLSPLLIPLLHDINGERNSATSVSMLSCGYYIVVGILGNFTGYCLDNLNFPAFNEHSAYFIIFAFCSVVAVWSCFNCFKIEESAKTKRILQYVKHHSEIEENPNHWHDKYEHDLYNNI